MGPSAGVVPRHSSGVVLVLVVVCFQEGVGGVGVWRLLGSVLLVGVVGAVGRCCWTFVRCPPPTSALKPPKNKAKASQNQNGHFFVATILHKLNLCCDMWCGILAVASRRVASWLLPRFGGLLCMLNLPLTAIVYLRQTLSKKLGSLDE